MVLLVAATVHTLTWGILDEALLNEADTECVQGSCNGLELHLLQRRGELLHDIGIDGQRKYVIKGISYGPSPLTTAGAVGTEDFSGDDSKPMWSGRGDLAVMKSLGANTVRLYGNDPDMEHDDFLNYAHFVGLRVIPGNGDAAFQSCLEKGDFNCHSGVKEAYYKNLKKGFCQRNGTYHSSISHVIVVNEPELKLPNLQKPRSWVKAIATAIDGMLDAEAQAEVVGPKPNLTVTFSFAACGQCTKFNHIPALGQMWELRDALLNPRAYDITSNNDLGHLFRNRFTYGFNTGNPSDEIQDLFLRHYEKEFPSTPIFVGEYHNPGNPNTQKDLEHMIAMAEASSVFLGISFFEFQNRYDIGNHLVWGMFDPQDQMGGSLQILYGSTTYNVPCLSPVFDATVQKTLPAQVAAAYGGPGIDAALLCEANPGKVHVSAHGFDQVLGSKNSTAMGLFIERVVEHMGGFVPDGVPDDFARINADPYATYRNLEALLSAHPDWARWDLQAACVVDETSLKSEVGNTIGYVCGLGHVNCGAIPVECKEKVWDTASWVFGTHFREVAYLKDGPLRPLEECNWHGVAKFQRESSWAVRDLKTTCIVPLGEPDAQKVFVSPYGFNLMWIRQSKQEMKRFLKRAVEHMGGAPGAYVPANFVQSQLNENSSFGGLIQELGQHPTWAHWSSTAACVPNPKAAAADVGSTIGAVCSKGVFDCGQIPAACKDNVWNTAAFAFGSYYKTLSHSTQVHPLRDCAWKGTALVAHPTNRKNWRIDLKEECIISVTNA